jgi:hypothetical protein
MAHKLKLLLGVGAYLRDCFLTSLLGVVSSNRGLMGIAGCARSRLGDPMFSQDTADCLAVAKTASMATAGTLLCVTETISLVMATAGTLSCVSTTTIAISGMGVTASSSVAYGCGIGGPVITAAIIMATTTVGGYATRPSLLAAHIGGTATMLASPTTEPEQMA